MSWTEAFAPSQKELYGAQQVYWHLVHTVLSALKPCLGGHASRDEQILLQSLAVFLLVKPFDPLLRWSPKPYSPNNLDRLPDWEVVTRRVVAAVQGIAESKGRPFAELIDAHFALEVHAAGSLWEAIPEVFFRHLPLACEVFGEEIGVLPAGLRQELLVALDSISTQRPDFAVTAIRQLHAGRQAGVDAQAPAFPESMVELGKALGDSANYWGMVYKDCYLRRMSPIAKLQELNQWSNGPHADLPAWARHELVYPGKTPGASHGLLQTDEGDTTAFVTFVGQGLIAVIPKGTTQSQLAQMLPELAVGEFYVPAWDLLRRGLLGETCGQAAIIDATEPVAPISPAKEQPPSPVTSSGTPLYTRDECVESRRHIEDVLLSLGHPNPIVGESDAVMQIYPALERVHMNRRRRLNILLLGEPGSGKQVLAEMIHGLSGRKAPIVQENAPSMQGQLALAALFGARKGSWTGIDEDRDGLFTKAANGVLFLDNMQRSDISTQAAILNAIEQRPGEFRRLGDTDSQPTTCWLVAAINESVNALVAHGRLVPDLPRRFDYAIEVPALKDRLTDIPLLVRHFVCLRAHDEGFCAPDELLSLVQTDEIIRRCQAKDWAAPVAGNVGGLKNMVNQLLDDQLILLRKEGRLPLLEERLLELPPHEFSEYLAATLPDGTGPLVLRDWGGMLCDPGRVVRAIRASKGNTDDLAKELLGSNYDYLMKCLVERFIEEDRDAERAWRPFYLLLAKWLQHQRQRQTGRALRKQLPAR